MSEVGVATPSLEDGRKLFASDCRFIWAATMPDQLPAVGPPEAAFAGRSNVGKSSLLNALTNRRSLARTSGTPGRTQALNFFALGSPSVAAQERVRLVDMPGYGYAAASKERIAHWTALMRCYLCGRATLARVFVLVDARHGLKALDQEMFEMLDSAAVSYQVVLTKADAVRPAGRQAVVEETLAALRKHVAAHPEVVVTSSQTGEGLAELRDVIGRLLVERGR